MRDLITKTTYKHRMASYIGQKFGVCKILDDKHIQCALCSKTYKQPKCLGCLHIFCLICLEGHMRNNLKEGQIACPTCKEMTKIPEGGIRNLKDSILMRSLIDEASVFKSSNIKCSKCRKDKMATMACADCSSYLCDDCYSAHQDFVEKSHNIFDVSKLANMKQLEEFQRNRFQICDIHKEAKKLFCRTDKTQICSICAFTANHRGHDVWSLQEQVDETVAKVDAQLQDIKPKQGQIDEENKNINKLIDRIKKEKTESLKKLEEQRNAMQKILDQKYKEIELKLVKTTDDDISILEEKLKKNKVFTENIDGKHAELKAMKVIPISSCMEAVCELQNSVQDKLSVSKMENIEGSDLKCVQQFVQSDLKQFEQQTQVGIVKSDIPRQYLTGEEVAKVIKVGDRVVRGQDWNISDYSDQDGNPPGAGTVVKINDKSEYNIHVKWDFGHSDVYRMCNDMYDLKFTA